MGNDFDFDSFCQEHDIILRISENLGTKIRGFCYYDGIYYYVILNNRFTYNQLRETTIHEIIHVLNNHFFCDVSYAEQCESEVHTIINRLESYQHFFTSI